MNTELIEATKRFVKTKDTGLKACPVYGCRRIGREGDCPTHGKALA